MDEIEVGHPAELFDRALDALASSFFRLLWVKYFAGHVDVSPFDAALLDSLARLRLGRVDLSSAIMISSKPTAERFATCLRGINMIDTSFQGCNTAVQRLLLCIAGAVAPTAGRVSVIACGDEQDPYQDSHGISAPSASLKVCTLPLILLVARWCVSEGKLCLESLRWA